MKNPMFASTETIKNEDLMMLRGVHLEFLQFMSSEITRFSTAADLY